MQADKIVAGGLVGLALGPIDNCHASGNVTATASVGGLVGRSDTAAADITDSWATGAANTTTAEGEVGGLVGEAQGATLIDNCYATGNASGGQRVGGLVGFLNASTISNSSSSGMRLMVKLDPTVTSRSGCASGAW